jgi:hypothetical protein
VVVVVGGSVLVDVATVGMVVVGIVVRAADVTTETGTGDEVGTAPGSDALDAHPAATKTAATANAFPFTCTTEATVAPKTSGPGAPPTTFQRESTPRGELMSSRELLLRMSPDEASRGITARSRACGRARSVRDATSKRSDRT